MNLETGASLAYITHLYQWESVGLSRSALKYAKFSKIVTYALSNLSGCNCIGKFEPRSRHILSPYEPRHEISNNVVCATSKTSDQPAHTRSLIKAFAGRLNVL